MPAVMRAFLLNGLGLSHLAVVFDGLGGKVSD